jgi:2-oxoacid:acceptor oxidoreductase gamma subunit (pyruvate/2-ketoisovalerate family)
MKQIKIYGIGGQGVVTAATLLASAIAMYEDRYASTIPTFGHERRGAPVYADVMVDQEPILLNSFSYDPDLVIVMDETIIDKGVKIAQGILEHTILLLNTTSAEVAMMYKNDYGFANVYWADATSIAAEHIGRAIPSGSILGLIAKAGLVSIESCERALKDYFPGKAGGQNADAARKTYETTQEG